MSIYSTLTWLESEGARDGRERGRREGLSRQTRKLLLRHGKKRHGPPAPEQMALLDALAEHWGVEQLEQARDRLPTAADWPALLAGLVPPQGRPPDPDYLLPFEFEAYVMPPSIDEYAEVRMMGQKKVVHIRMQRLYQADLGKVLYEDAQKKQAEYGAPVQTAVLLMWPGADGPGMTGEYQAPGGTYRYSLSRLWERDPEEMFDSPGTVVMAGLAKFDPERLPEIVRRTEEAIDALSSDEEMKANLWLVTYGNLGLRFPAARVNDLLAPKLPGLLRTPGFRRLLSNGYYEGFDKGLAAGDEEATRGWVTALGKALLGEPPAEFRAVLEGIDNLDRLEQLTAKVLKAGDWRAVFAPN